MKKLLLAPALVLALLSAAPLISSAQTTNANCSIVTRNLSLGLAGTEVSALQRFLTDQGFNVSIVGRFGPQTRAAVKLFQSAHGISATGTVGPMTRQLIIQLKCPN